MPYGTRAEADAYFAEQGIAAWAAASVPTREAALVRATAYLDRRYAGRWRGVRATAGQPLAWPRTGVFDGDGYAVASDAVPQAVKSAAAEAALAVIEGVPLERRPGDEMPLVSKSVQAEGVSVSKTFATPPTGARAHDFAALDALLEGLIYPARSSGGFLARA